MRVASPARRPGRGPRRVRRAVATSARRAANGEPARVARARDETSVLVAALAIDAVRVDATPRAPPVVAERPRRTVGVGGTSGVTRAGLAVPIASAVSVRSTDTAETIHAREVGRTFVGRVTRAVAGDASLPRLAASFRAEARIAQRGERGGNREHGAGPVAEVGTCRVERPATPEHGFARADGGSAVVRARAHGPAQPVPAALAVAAARDDAPRARAADAVCSVLPAAVRSGSAHHTAAVRTEGSPGGVAVAVHATLRFGTRIAGACHEARQSQLRPDHPRTHARKPAMHRLQRRDRGLLVIPRGEIHGVRVDRD